MCEIMEIGMNLKDCRTRDDVESVFKEKEISSDNFEAKNALLLDAMSNPRMFYSIGNPTNEQKYELIIASFLSRKWEYAEIMRNRGN